MGSGKSEVIIDPISWLMFTGRDTSVKQGIKRVEGENLNQIGNDGRNHLIYAWFTFAPDAVR